jgi:hypothetical protein
MSDTTFFVVPAASPALPKLRAGLRRTGNVAGQIARAVHTYSLIEAACLLAAAAFTGVMIAKLFGLPV